MCLCLLTVFDTYDRVIHLWMWPSCIGQIHHTGIFATYTPIHVYTVGETPWVAFTTDSDAAQDECDETGET